MEDREDEYKVTRIKVDEVVVRYAEGTLPPELIDALVEDARAKLALLENADCKARRLGP